MTGPLPDVTDPDFSPFWDAARRRVLVVQRCDSCGAHRWPPRPICPTCHGLGTEWVEVTPTGTLHTWTVVAHQTTPGLPPPFVVGLVELDSPRGVRMLGRVVTPEPDRLSIGLPVTAEFHQLTDEVSLVFWAPEDTGKR